MPLPQYHIEARSYGILGFASHNFWALVDDNGNTIRELHGFATDPITKVPIPIGTIGDELKFYQYFYSPTLQPGRLG